MGCIQGQRSDSGKMDTPQQMFELISSNHMLLDPY